MGAVAYVLVRGVIAMAIGQGLSAARSSRATCRSACFIRRVAIVIVILILVVAGGGARLTLVKLNKIYTRTGDGGTAGLVDGSRVSANRRPRMAAIGEVDEANAAIGVAIAALTPGELADRLAAHPERDVRPRRRRRDAVRHEFEGSAAHRRPAGRAAGGGDRRDERRLEPLTSFILPGGSTAVAAPPGARRSSAAPSGPRSRCTRPSRSILTLLAYLNRLSDHLFVAARHLAAGEGGDVLWQPGATRQPKRSGRPAQL